MKTRAAARRTNHKILREIAMYRDLIHKAAARNEEKFSQDNQSDPLDTVTTSPSLSRLLKCRRDLAGQGMDPATSLRHALDKLEVEWVELKRFGEDLKEI